MSVHAIKNATAPRSPARAALAGAIEVAAAAERAEAAAREAVSRALELVDDGTAKVAAMVAAVSVAKENHGAAVASAIGKGAPVPASTLKGARVAQADAEDDLSARVSALATLQEALADREAETADANMAREATINAVLADEARALVASVIRCREKLIELLSVSAFLQSRSRARQGQTSSFRIIPQLSMAGIETELATALEKGVPLSNNIETALAHPVVAVWESACAALRTDPDAALPTD